jgi:hypothetical protein
MQTSRAVGAGISPPFIPGAGRQDFLNHSRPPLNMSSGFNSAHIFVRRATSCILADMGLPLGFPRVSESLESESLLLRPIATPREPCGWRSVVPTVLGLFFHSCWIFSFAAVDQENNDC